MFLTKSGFNVSKSFTNGKELVEYISSLPAREEPDLIIIDYQMPLMNGLEATKILRATNLRLKIILASAYDLPEDGLGYFDAELRKPFSPKDLLDVVSKVIQ